jgi:hypothetical protein
MLLGVFDLCILIIILIFNFWLRKYRIIKKCNWIFYLVAFLFFGFIFPVLSVHFEIQKVTEANEEMDSFNFLYTFFRFPVWWFFGILEIIYLKFIMNKVK